MKQDNQREAVLFAYLAGIIDGEGTIRIGRSMTDSRGNQRPTYYSAIQIGMCEEKIIDLFVKTFGSNKRTERVLQNRKQIYRWGTCGTQRVPEIIEKLLPYLIVKKTQAEIVIEFCKHKEKSKFNKYNMLSDEELRRREELYQKVKKLNAVGALATTKSNDTREGEAIV